jgi:hypothetical protein
MPTLKARRECAEWLSYCLKIGWAKASLDELEKIWWRFHDGQGRLVNPQITNNN